MSRSDAIKFLILRSIGNFLVLFAIFVLLAIFGPAIYYEVAFRIMQARGITYTINSENIHAVFEPKVSFANVLTGPKEQILIPIDPLFDILIPKIGANARVFPNIDASKIDIFLPILQQGVAHAQGTVFPGMKGNIYLFAHSTDNFWNVGRYNTVFYLLKDLTVGDQVVIFFQNRRHNYIVSESKVIGAQDVSYINHAQTEEEQLILQTCWPPGTTWKRLIVIAKPK